MKLGRLQWGAIGIVTLLIVVMAPSGNEGVNEKSAPRQNRLAGGSTPASTADGQRTHEVGHVDMERLSRLEMRNSEKNNVGDAFNTNSWYQPPPPSHSTLPSNPVVPLPLPVVVQTAPPMPFTYLGRYGDTPSRTVILSIGDRVYTVSVGDVIENNYRVEKFTPGMINLTYLPLSIEQHLATGETM